jgi:hypothetical protein
MKHVIEYRDVRDKVSEIDVIKNNSDTYYYAKEISEIEAEVKIHSNEDSFSECNEIELFKDNSDHLKASLEEVILYNLEYIKGEL